MTTTEDKNRFVAEKLGMCWHKPALNFSRYCHKCGKTIPKEDTTGNIVRPDFSTDSGAIQLLRLMEEHPEGSLFFARLIYSGTNVESIDDDGYIPRKIITAPGALFNAVWEFFGGKDEPT